MESRITAPPPMQEFTAHCAPLATF